MTFTTSNGITLHFSDQGRPEAPAIVCLNSLGTDLRIWDGVAGELANRFRVICYDKRGHGLSQSTSPPYSLSDHVSDLSGLLGELQISQVFFVGLSVGGMIALKYAAGHNDQVQGLILCDTAAVIGPPEIWTDRIDAVRRSGIGAMADTIMQRWFAPDFREHHPARYAGLRNMLARTDTDGYIGTCIAIRDADLTTAAKSIDVPTLCLCGTEDSATPPGLVRSLASLIPDAEFDLIDNAGHLPCIEQPANLTRRMTQFIDEKCRPGDNDKSRFEAGMSTRRAVLGDDYVDIAERNKTAFDEDFQRLITETAWGSVWSRPGLNRRERSLLTIAMLAALGHEDELAMHIRATRNTGASQADVQEVLLQVAIYAGVPAANKAIKIAKAVYKELDASDKEEGNDVR